MIPSPLWIFGYGSIVWRPEFAFAERRQAAIEGWARRFWQGSTDHRGVPGAPGRVVTLIEAPGETCVGMAYRVADTDRSAVLENLFVREKGGYSHHAVPLAFAGGEAATGLVFIAGEGNPNYLGPAALAAIAEQVARSHGPSGANDEYVLRLAGWLRDIGAEDDHVFEVEQAVLTLTRST